MMEEKKTGIERLIKAFFYSLSGLKATFKSEAAFRQEVLLTACLVPVAAWVSETPKELLLLIGSLVLVMVVELLNSAIESVVDRVGMEHHELSGRAKDAASAAVLVSILLAVACWLTVLFS